MARRARYVPNRGESGTRRGRGLVKKTKKWGQMKLQVIFNEYGQPCGGDNKELASQLGFFARDGHSFPLTVDWSEMNETVLENIWNDVVNNTNAPPEYKKICFESIAHSWRDRKCTAKRVYNAHETDEERLADRPEFVLPEQWVTLISKWGLEKSKEVSLINKNNRSKQEFLSRTGKQSHAELRKKREDEGKPTDRLSMFIATRTNAVGETLDRTTAHIIEAINDAVSELPDEERNSTTTRENIFTEHLGKDGHGRLRCMGRGVTKTMVFGRASTTESVAAMRSEFEEKMESQKLLLEVDFTRRLDAQRESQEAEFSRRLEAQRESQAAELSMRLNEKETEMCRKMEVFERSLMQLQARAGIEFQPM